MPVGETEFLPREPAGAVAVDDQRTYEDAGPVPAVRAGVHPDATAGRTRDRAGELEPAETGIARPVQRDGVGRASARDQPIVVDPRRRKLAAEPDHERLDALVADEQVGAQPDRHHRQLAIARPGEPLLELLERLRSRECT